MEKYKTKEHEKLHQQINNIVGRKKTKYTSSSCLKTKNEKKCQILGRWTDNIGDFLRMIKRKGHKL